MKIVFLYPRWTGEYGLFGHFARRNSTWPPLNLAMLAAVVEQAGHEAEIIDAEAENISEDALVQRALKSGADIFGLTCYSPFFHLNTSLAKKLKEKCNTTIIVGGPHITIMREKALTPDFDYMFVGEAENSLVDFLKVYEAKGDLATVGGIIFKKGEEVITGVSQWITTQGLKPTTVGLDYALDKLPLAARHLLPMKKYKLGNVNGRTYFTSIQATRGCYFRCIFCASKALNTTRVIARSPQSIVEEIKSIIREFPYIKHFYFVDDVLTQWEPYILEICDLIIKEGLKITFEGSTRANLVKEEVIEKMVQAGLIRLSFGLETVDSEMRKTMKKAVPLECYSEANRICEKYGVEAMNSVMIGLPGETRETVRKTLNWLRDAKEVKQANFAIAVPYPGTEFNDIAVSGTHGVELMSEDFSEYLRYGSAVTKVGDLTPQDLIELQNEGFVSIYSAPHRWPAMWRKHGVLGFLLMMLRVLKLWKRKFFKRNTPLLNHPKD